MEVVSAVKLAVDIEEMYRRSLPKGPYGGMSQNISFWRPLLHSLLLFKFTVVSIGVFLKSHQPSCVEICYNQREDPGFQFLDDLGEGQTFISFEILGIFAHPVLLIIFRIPLDFPW